VENSKLSKRFKDNNNTLSRKLNYVPHSLGISEGILETLYSMMSVDNNNNNKNNSSKIIKVNKNVQNSILINILMRIDFMLIYSISAILISIFIAFICLPIIFFFRKRVKFLNNYKIKEEKIVKVEELNELLCKFEMDQICSICLDRVMKYKKEGDLLGHLNCRHYFHKICILEWIKRNKQTCPFCRKIINSVKYLNTVDIEKFVNRK
jgi:hypothetical protein